MEMIELSVPLICMAAVLQMVVNSENDICSSAYHYAKKAFIHNFCTAYRNTQITVFSFPSLSLLRLTEGNFSCMVPPRQKTWLFTVYSLESSLVVGLTIFRSISFIRKIVCCNCVYCRSTMASQTRENKLKFNLLPSPACAYTASLLGPSPLAVLADTCTRTSSYGRVGPTL